MLAALDKINISKKLPIVIGGLACIAAICTGATAYMAAASTGHRTTMEQLQGTSNNKADAVKSFFADTEKQVTELASSPHISNALDRFSASYYELGPEAESILQKTYIDDNPNPAGQKEKLTSAATTTNYDAVHTALHPWFRTILRTNDYYDIFIFDASGRNVYTVYKELDFATQLADGRWKDSGLGTLVRKVLAGSPDATPVLEDFKPYAPSNNIPAGFVAAPIKGADGKIKGVVAVQLSIGKLDASMAPTAVNGKTGESTLVGSDKLARNNSPLDKSGTMLKRKLETHQAEAALNGETGVEIGKNALGQKSYIAYTPVATMGAKYAILSDITASEVDAPLNKLAMQVGLMVLLVAAAAAAIGLWFARTLTKPIADLTNSMGILASGDTDAEIPGSSRGDELGEMAKAVQVFKDNAIERIRLEGLSKEEAIKQIRRGEIISEATSSFEQVAGDMLRAVSAASAELNATAQAMTAAADRTNMMASSVAAAAEESTVNANTASNSASELSAATSQIQGSSTESAQIANEAVAISDEAQRAVSELVDAAHSVSEVVALIRGIAEQTNLLALNATIEAARAGAAGAGFAIVAQEVKNLANQTAGATDEIGTHIGNIQNVVNSASNAMHRITSVIGRISGIAGEIGTAVDNQAAVTSEIARSIQEVASASQSVTQDVIKVTETASETGVAASQVLSASSELSMQASKLEEETNNFLAKVRAA